MTDYGFEFIVERIIKNANESLNEAKENPNDEYQNGHIIAHYEILNIIKTELEVRGENLKDYGLDMNLEEVFLHY
ncbi:MAG: transposase [Clostridia bacterium]|nr:transposase [Clostridia bacterium]